MQSSIAPVYVLQLLTSAFLAILFLQSGIDKIVARQGNLQWLSGHFAKSPLAGMASLMFAVLTIIELAAGVLSGIGFFALLFTHNPTIALYGPVISAIAVLWLFFGQRITKEYAGAAVFVPYFLLTLIAV